MKTIIPLVLMIILLGGSAEGTQTKITVRAKSKDAKFIGSTMGGALVVIRDAETGEVLAKGSTIGSTGNTQKIMVDPIRREVPITDTLPQNSKRQLISMNRSSLPLKFMRHTNRGNL